MTEALNSCSGTFKLTLEFTEEYPNKAPVVKFKSAMFHPNSTFPVAAHICASISMQDGMHLT